MQFRSKTASLTLHKAGDLVIFSGRLIACDPLTLTDSEPFENILTPGYYPVNLIIANIERTNDQRIAYAILSLSEKTPISWEIATRSSEDLRGCLKSFEMSKTMPSA
jgi:Protein of unknown function (DUF4241)